MTVEAYDTSVPPQTADIFFIVNVIKNKYKPEFQRQPYTFEISESVQGGSVVYTSKY